MENTPEEEYEDFDSAGNFIKSMHDYHNKWVKKHPILNWLDEKFPKGYADYAIHYIITHPWEILREWKRQIKWAYQRVFRGWDDRASWHVGYHLAKIIPPIVRRLKYVGHGVPLRMYGEGEGLPHDIQELGAIDKDGKYIETEEDKEASAKWDKILDDIAEGFESYITYEEDYMWDIPLTEYEPYKKFLHALDLLKEYYEDLWD